MRKFLAIVWVAWLAGSPFALSMPGGEDGDVVRVLQRNPIEVEARGIVAVSYPDAVRMFASPSLLADVQAAYAALLPAGESPEFFITQTASDRYHYVNRSGQHTNIREVFRGEGEGGATEALFYSAGRRFFGDYEAVIHLVAGPDPGGTAYRVRVYAYPENRVSRFFARHLRLVHLFFRSKTAEIEALSVRISQALCSTDLASTGAPSL